MIVGDGQLPDPAVPTLAQHEWRILIANDNCFGELIWRQRLPHAGVMFFRMPVATARRKIERLQLVPGEHPEQLDHFIVVTPPASVSADLRCPSHVPRYQPADTVMTLPPS